MKSHCLRLCSVLGASFLPLWVSSGPTARADLTAGLLEQSDYWPMPWCGPFISIGRTSVQSCWLICHHSLHGPRNNTNVKEWCVPGFVNKLGASFREVSMSRWVLAGKGSHSHTVDLWSGKCLLPHSSLCQPHGSHAAFPLLTGILLDNI